MASNRVSYGYAFTGVSKNNYESSNLLNNNDFAKEGLSVKAHVVFSVNKHTFTNSPTELAWYPPVNKLPQTCGKIIMWELFSRVGYDMLTNPEPDKGADATEPNEEEEIHPRPEVPKVVYRSGDGLRSNENHMAGFNNMLPEQQQAFVDQQQYVVVDNVAEYNNQMADYQTALADYETLSTKKGRNYVLIEYFKGKTNPDNVGGYRIWILQEEGAKGNLNTKFAERIASVNNAKATGKRKRYAQTIEQKYASLWKNINSNQTFAKTIGNTLYNNSSHFNITQACTKTLVDKENPVYPEHVFSVGQWNQLVNGTDGSIDENGQPIRMNMLPCFYEKCDIDSERFIWQNYFNDNLTKFQPKEEFRDSMILLNARDLVEEHFMSKHRLDAYIKYVLPMMRTTLGSTLKPKASKPIASVSNLNPVVSARKAFESKPIIPSKEPQFEGQSFECIDPSANTEVMGVKGKMLYPGQSNSFYYQRALAHQFIKPFFDKMMKVAKTRLERKIARVKSMEKALEYIAPIFNGVGNCNIGNGLRGIINTQERLKKQNFSSIFIEMPNLHEDLHFQDNFMCWVLNGAEFYMYLSTLQCDSYRLLINAGCAYLLIRDKTHNSQTGDPGTGKSELYHVITMCKCPGVCEEEANASALSHFFGKDRHFCIKIRNEPDPMRDGGAAIKGNAAAMRLTEIEKSIRSEQEGWKSISQFDTVQSKYVELKIHVWLSMVIMENSNHCLSKRSKARNDRDHKEHIAKTIRQFKTVAYMKSSQGNQSSDRARDTQMFIHKNHWIDQELAKVCAMMDIDGGLQDVNFAIFDDVQDYLQGELDLNTRSIERCRNNCRTQIQYNVINILFHHRPYKKTLQFYIGDERVCSALNKKMGELEVFVDDDETTSMYKFEHDCVLYRSNDFKLHSRDSDTEERTPVNCVIDLINNRIFSKDPDNIDEVTGEPGLVAEEQLLKRLWVHKKSWRSGKNYKQGDICRLHIQGKDSGYASYYKIYQCLQDNKNKKPTANSIYWKLTSKKKESCLGKYFQQEIKYRGEEATEQWMDINRLMYCDVGTAIRTMALMRSEFVAASQDKIHSQIVQRGLKKLRTIDANAAWKSFYPLRDLARPESMDDVDTNYICIGAENMVKLELTEQLKKKLTVGLIVNTSDIVLESTINNLSKNTTANVYYNSFGNQYPSIDDNGAWKLPYETGQLNGTRNLRNHELKARNLPYKTNPVIMKKKFGSSIKLYILVSWLDDCQHDTHQEEDRFLGVLSKYKYFAKEPEKTTILVGHPWTGKVTYKDREQNVREKDWCDPSISKSITIEGGPRHEKVFKEKNVVDPISQKIQGKKKIHGRPTIHTIDVHYDDYAMKLRLQELHEYDESEHDSIDPFCEAYSVRYLKDELNTSQPPILDKRDVNGQLIEYSKQHAQAKHDNETR